MNKLEIGDKVWTVKGVGWIEVINPTSSGIHYLVKLTGNHGSYYFTQDQVFKYENQN